MSISERVGSAESNAPEPLSFSAMADRPLVSILIPNYNYADYIEQAIDSALAQTWPHFEIVVCDDGSTDDSWAILTRLASSHSKLLIIQQENQGQAAAFNTAYSHCSGDIICLLDPDDLYSPEKLERVVLRFQQNSQAGLVYHRYRPIDTAGNEIGRELPPDLHVGWLFEKALGNGTRSFFWKTTELALRRELAEVVFPIRTEINNASDSYIGGLSVFLAEVDAIPESLSYYRIHQTNTVATVGLSAKSELNYAQMIETNVPLVRDALRKRYGDAIADRLRLEDNPYYWEHLRTAYILSGKPRGGVGGRIPEELLLHISEPKRARIWKLLFAAPTLLSRRLLTIWFGNGLLKKILKRGRQRGGGVSGTAI